MTVDEFNDLLNTLKQLPVFRAYTTIGIGGTKKINSVCYQGEIYIVYNYNFLEATIYKGYEIDSKFIKNNEAPNRLSFMDGKFLLHSEKDASEIIMHNNKIETFYYINGQGISPKDFQINKDKISLKEKINKIY